MFLPPPPRLTNYISHLRGESFPEEEANTADPKENSDNEEEHELLLLLLLPHVRWCLHLHCTVAKSHKVAKNRKQVTLMRLNVAPFHDSVKASPSVSLQRRSRRPAE